jgi:hypothetical protein
MHWLATVPNNSTARFWPNACYVVNRLVRVGDRQRLTIDGNGSTFHRTRFLPGAPASIWRFEGGSNLTLENMTIRGTDPTDSYNSSKVQEHAIGVYGVQTFVATNITASHVWGDCLTDGFDWRTRPPTPPNQITFQNSTCDSGRQGVSAITGNGFYVRSNTFLGSRFTEIDLEPDTDNEILTNVMIDGNSFYHPEWQVGPEVSIAGCLISIVEITNNRDIASTTSGPIQASHASPGCYEHDLTVSGNTWLLNSYGAYGAPVEVRQWRQVTVSNNTFVANVKYTFGYILNLHDSAHVWYSDNSIIGPYADKWQKVKTDKQCYDVNV